MATNDVDFGELCIQNLLSGYPVLFIGQDLVLLMVGGVTGQILVKFVKQLSILSRLTHRLICKEAEQMVFMYRHNGVIRVSVIPSVSKWVFSF